MPWSAWILALACLGILLPGAGAQVEGPYVELAATPVGEPIEPITGQGHASVDVTLKCDTGTVSNEPRPLRVGLVIETEEDWLIAVLPKAIMSTNMTAAECLSGSEARETVPVALFVSKDAPALATSRVIMTATPEGGTPAVVAWEETAGVFMKTHISFDRTIMKARAGDELVFVLDLLNEGNSAVRASFTHNDAALEVQIPDPVEVQAGAEETVDVQVRTPGTGLKGEAMTLKVQVDFVSVDDPNVTSRAETSALVHGQGLIDAPAPGALPVVMTLVFVAAFLRRQRPVPDQGAS